MKKYCITLIALLYCLLVFPNQVQAAQTCTISPNSATVDTTINEYPISNIKISVAGGFPLKHDDGIHDLYYRLFVSENGSNIAQPLIILPSPDGSINLNNSADNQNNEAKDLFKKILSAPEKTYSFRAQKIAGTPEEVVCENGTFTTNKPEVSNDTSSPQEPFPPSGTINIGSSNKCSNISLAASSGGTTVSELKEGVDFITFYIQIGQSELGNENNWFDVIVLSNEPPLESPLCQNGLNNPVCGIPSEVIKGLRPQGPFNGEIKASLALDMGNNTQLFQSGSHTVEVVKYNDYPPDNSLTQSMCTFSYMIGTEQVTQRPDIADQLKSCKLTARSKNLAFGKDLTSHENVVIDIMDVPKTILGPSSVNYPYINPQYELRVYGHSDGTKSFKNITPTDNCKTSPLHNELELCSKDINIGDGYEDGKTYQVELWTNIPEEVLVTEKQRACWNTFTINDKDGGSTGETTVTAGKEPPPELKKVCENINASENLEEFNSCEQCLLGGNAWTAFGCIPTDPGGFLKTFVFGIGLGLAGVIAFLLMIWGGFSIVISQGDPQRIQHGKEIIVSALAGLLLIIFSVLILRIVGVDIIKIPGFDSVNSQTGKNSGDTEPKTIQSNGSSEQQPLCITSLKGDCMPDSVSCESIGKDSKAAYYGCATGTHCCVPK